MSAKSFRKHRKLKAFDLLGHGASHRGPGKLKRPARLIHCSVADHLDLIKEGASVSSPSSPQSPVGAHQGTPPVIHCLPREEKKPHRSKLGTLPSL